VSCAMTLARTKSGKLSKDDLTEIVSLARDFKDDFKI